MPTLPLPILTFVLSAIACALVWRLNIGNRLARGWFTSAFVVIAAGTLLTGLRFGYGLEQLASVQRLLPLFVGPLIYLGFVSLTQPAERMRRITTLHILIACLAALVPQAVPLFRPGYDLIIGLSYSIYIFALILLWNKGIDNLAYARLNITRGLRQWMLAAAGMLGVTLIFDTGIAINFALQRSDDAIMLISYGSIVTIIGVIIAIIIFSRQTEQRPAAKQVNTIAQSNNAKLESSARSLMMETQLYLDTNLTLDRLAKRLHVPARALSEAINQKQNVNVSKYVNEFRVHHAAKLLETSDLSITQIMDKSGFLTRSNFYREFERVHAQSPTEYRKRGIVE